MPSRAPCPVLSRIPCPRTDWLTQCFSLSSNSFFLIPVFHFPWSEKGREERLASKTASNTA
jgi:hypothetical protein